MLISSNFLSRFGIFLFVFLAACTPAPEWNRDRQAAVTSFTLPNTSPREAARIAEKVLRLADGSDVSFDYRQDGFRASRKYNVYFVIGWVSGDYIFDLTARQATGGTKVEMKIYVDSTTVTASGPIPTTASLWQQEGAYRLFFSRMMALKDGNTSWISCKDAPKNLGFSSVHFEPLCTVASDQTP